LVRKALFAVGFRYRLHRRDLPGTPDLVFPKHRAVILIHGCFCHGHGCHLFVVPKTNRKFCITKITSNKKRDSEKLNELIGLGWRVLTIWECALRGTGKKPLGVTAGEIHSWLTGSLKTGEIPSLKCRRQFEKALISPMPTE
jgi:DNA mismatch endonuclease (patch repair protein)